MSEEPVPLGEALGGATRRFGMGEARHVARLFSAWPDIVGDSVAAHVEPVSLRDGVLRLRADSPSWATEITYLRERIRTQVNEALGSVIAQKIDVTTGPKQGPRRRSGSRAEPSPRDPSEAREPRDPDDPIGAFERAFVAWKRRRSRGC